MIMILAPDTEQQAIYEADDRARTCKPGDALFFAHGFNIRFGLITPPPGVDVAMVAPKGPGHLVRRTYEGGGGVPSLIAVAQDAIGQGPRPGPVLRRRHRRHPGRRARDHLRRGDRDRPLRRAGRAVRRPDRRSIQAGFETLVEAGYQPESAYFECLHEVKLIVDLMYEHGIAGMRYSISDTAEYGDLTRGPRVINDAVQAEMKTHPRRDPVRQLRRGVDRREPGRPAPASTSCARPGRDHPIEKVGAELRAMMPFISAGAQRPQDVSGG